MEHVVRCNTSVLVKEQMWLIYGELFHTKSSVERQITSCFLHPIWSNAYWKKYDSSLEKIIDVTENMLTWRAFLLKSSERIVCAVWKGHHQNLHNTIVPSSYCPAFMQIRTITVFISIWEPSSKIQSDFKRQSLFAKLLIPCHLSEQSQNWNF